MAASCCGGNCQSQAEIGKGGKPALTGTGRGVSFRISGMCCVEEVAALRAGVGPLVGGADNLAFDILNGRMIVLSGDVASDAIVRAVARTGMKAQPWSAANASGADENGRRRRQAILTGASGAMTGIGFVLESLMLLPVPAHAVEAVAVVIGLWFVLPKAWLAIRRQRPDMNLLMTVAVIGAIGLGDWLEAASVSFLFALSLTLESWSAGRARHAIAALMDLSPPTVRVKSPGGEVEMAPSEVPVGAVFVVHPGERIPLDGRILSGESGVNQAPITGESVPVAKAPGAEVFAGTVNGDGALEVENLKHAQETTLAHISRMVAEAQSRRSATERWVDRFAAVYTPIVMGLALAVMVAPPLLLGAEWSDWIYRALVLLVIACPCALVISTPVTVVAAMASAARNGILVKGGEHLETPARLTVVAFDKTGTITEGKPSVETVVPLNGHGEEDLLARAAALEARSTHPIAQAIIAYAVARGVRPVPAQGVQAVPGKGVIGTFNDRAYWLGSHRYLEERGGETPELHALAEQLEAGGQSVVVIGSEEHVCGLIALTDAVRPEAAAALAALRRAGVEKLVMLTGDNRETANRIAAAAGIDEVRAELLPADKVTAIGELVARHGAVAMVGDGVNDAPAMVQANLGIAMAAAGTDTAIETADIALMSDDLSKLPWLIAHSRRMLSVIRGNIAFALGVKAVFAVLAFAGIATLWGAIVADMGTSLLVVFNGLRMLGDAEGMRFPRIYPRMSGAAPAS